MKKLFFFTLTLACVTLSMKAQNTTINNGHLHFIRTNGANFAFSPSWQTGNNRLSIAGNGGNGGTNWDWDNELVFHGTTGELEKQSSNGNRRAITVTLNGTRNFQVMGDGTVFAREVEVNLGPFPDYVFANNYCLPSLNELDKFIKQNKHLPNVPSAKEVEENGIGLGELARLELEKIEELSLYIIQLHKRIEALEEKLNATEGKE